MLSDNGKIIKCDGPGCTWTIDNHRWGKTKSGWFFSQMDGKSYCPEHIPAWVGDWRRSKGRV